MPKKVYVGPVFAFVAGSNVFSSHGSSLFTRKAVSTFSYSLVLALSLSLSLSLSPLGLMSCTWCDRWSDSRGSLGYFSLSFFGETCSEPTYPTSCTPFKPSLLSPSGFQMERKREREREREQMTDEEFAPTHARKITVCDTLRGPAPKAHFGPSLPPSPASHTLTLSLCVPILIRNSRTHTYIKLIHTSDTLTRV